jgi:hypothetical protein
VSPSSTISLQNAHVSFEGVSGSASLLVVLDHFTVDARRNMLAAGIEGINDEGGLLGKIEDQFLQRVGLCLDPFSLASSDIADKAFRAHIPEAGKTERDRNARAALRKRRFDEALEIADYSEESIYPGMGIRFGVAKEDHLAVQLAVAIFDRLTEKIVRGIYYVADSRACELEANSGMLK